MKMFLVLFLGIMVSAFAKAQSLPSPHTTEKSLIADQFYGVDDFNNFYYGKNNVFYKVGAEAITNTKNQQFYDIQLGELTSVDLINPLKILLFYRDTQTVVLLDNRLNESLRIKLSELQPYRYFEFASLAGERRLWLYNMDLQRLELFDYINDKLIVSSPPIKAKVSLLLSDYNYAHLITDRGVSSYNNYGSKTADLEIAAVSNADYDFEELVLVQKDSLLTYKFSKDYTFQKKENSWDYENQAPLKSLYLKDGKLYLYRLNRISVCSSNQKKN